MDKKQSNTTSDRKLAAILFADIVGYTSLMQHDEQNASTLLRHFQKQMESKVVEHKGRIVNFYGDGALCTFQIPIDAVRCAMDLQSTFQSAPAVPVRVGIHSGTVTQEEDKIFGDSVNIASRIESMGVAGSVLLSKKVRDEVKNNPDLQLRSLGSFEFKNVEEPMEIFALSNVGFAIPKPEELKGKLKKTKSKVSLLNIGIVAGILAILGFFYFNKTEPDSAPDIITSQKSIAVIPFADMSPDKDQEYFSDGIMEEILNHLVKIEGLQVTSRTSSMTYKGSNKKTSEIAQELGVAKILEGSVRKAGDVLRITVQFIDAKTDKHIWSETYDGNLENVFEMQSDIARQVANQLRAQITPDVGQRIDQIPTQNMEAYSLYLKADRGRGSPEKNALLEEALRLDPGFAEAYVALGRNKLYRVLFGRDTLPENLEGYLQEVDDLLDKGLELNPNLAEAYIHKGAKNVWFDWDFKKAQISYEKVLSLNPSAQNIAYTELLLALGDFEGALKNSTQTINANQSSRWVWLQHATVFYFLEQPQKAEEALSFAKEGNWITISGNYLRLMVFMGKYEEMLSNYETIPESELYPRAMGYAAISYYHTGQQMQVDTILATLEQQSLESPIGSPAFHLALIHAQMGNLDLAFEWLDKAYEDREVEMYWLKVEPPFRPLYNDPRWTELLYKVGFDVEIKG